MSSVLEKKDFIMPAEWEMHSATWLAWPNDDDYFEDRMKHIEQIYLKVILALHKNEQIKLLVLNDKVEENLDSYKKRYDIVLLNDTNMNYVNNLLRGII